MRKTEATIAVLFARRDSLYKTIPCCDVWDVDRDARNWPGGSAAIAHPPCRAWGRLRSFANPDPGEKELALFAAEQIRKWGGVLEHPYKSTLWAAVPLPLPGYVDEYGGWTLAAPQYWMGHAAEKATWFYIVGVKPSDLPPIPLRLGEPDFVVQSRKRADYRKHIPKADRERTPLACALWLVEVAKMAATHQGEHQKEEVLMSTPHQLNLGGFGPSVPPDQHARRVLLGAYGPFPLTKVQTQVLRLLLFHQGAERAIPLRDVMGKLRAWHGTRTTEREIKEAVRSLTVDFRVRIAAPRMGKTGYYLVTTSAEARAAARPYIAEGIKLFQRARILLDPHDVAELDGQIRLMLNGDKEAA